MDTPATDSEPSSHDSTLTRKSIGGELEYLLECLFHPFPVDCTCVENVLAGPESACLKNRIAKLLGLPYEFGRQPGKCRCKGAWMSLEGFRKWRESGTDDYTGFADILELGFTEGSDEGEDSDEKLQVERSGTNIDSEDIGRDTGLEDSLVELMNLSDTSDGDPEAGGMGVGPDSASAVWDGSDAVYCEEHGGWKGNPKRLCDTCKELHGSGPMYCQEHGGWEGNLKMPCKACQEVYGSPDQVRVVYGFMKAIMENKLMATNSARVKIAQVRPITSKGEVICDGQRLSLGN